MSVERVLHPRNKRIHILLRRLWTARRRHLMSAQLAQGLFPDLRVIRRRCKIQSVQREATGLQACVVAGDAVGGHHRAMWIRRGFSRRFSGRSLPQGSDLQDCRKSDRHHNSTRGNETLHGWQSMLDQRFTEIPTEEHSFFIIDAKGLEGHAVVNAAGKCSFGGHSGHRFPRSPRSKWALSSENPGTKPGGVGLGGGGG